jgi:hypothetical protein
MSSKALNKFLVMAIARTISPMWDDILVEAIDTVPGSHESFASGLISFTLRPAESKLLLVKTGQKP